MKPTYNDLTKKQKKCFGNGCGGAARWLRFPDFIFKADCNHHDFNYGRGGNLVDKLKADFDMFRLTLKDAVFYKGFLGQKLIYASLSVLYYLVLTLLPVSYFMFSWGKYKTIEEILEADKLDKWLNNFPKNKC